MALQKDDQGRTIVTQEQYDKLVGDMKEKYNYDEMTDEEKEKFDDVIDSRLVVSDKNESDDRDDGEDDDAEPDSDGPERGGRNIEKIKDGLRQKYNYDEMTKEEQEQFDQRLDQFVYDDSQNERDEHDEHDEGDRDGPDGPDGPDDGGAR